MSRIPKEFWSTFTKGVKNLGGRVNRSLVDLPHTSLISEMPSQGKMEVHRVLDGLAKFGGGGEYPADSTQFHSGSVIRQRRQDQGKARDPGLQGESVVSIHRLSVGTSTLKNSSHP